jgi:hypothetical protein
MTWTGLIIQILDLNIRQMMCVGPMPTELSLTNFSFLRTMMNRPQMLLPLLATWTWNAARMAVLKLIFTASLLEKAFDYIVQKMKDRMPIHLTRKVCIVISNFTS